MLHFIVILLIKQTDRWTDKHQQQQQQKTTGKTATAKLEGNIVHGSMYHRGDFES